MVVRETVKLWRIFWRGQKLGKRAVGLVRDGAEVLLSATAKHAPLRTQREVSSAANLVVRRKNKVGRNVLLDYRDSVRTLRRIRPALEKDYDFFFHKDTGIFGAKRR